MTAPPELSNVSPPKVAPGRLILVPNALDLGAEVVDIREVLPDGVLRLASGLLHWAAEDARSTRAFLKRVDAVHALAQPLQAMDIRELPRPRKGVAPAVQAQADAQSGAPSPWRELLKPVLAGHDMGLISEAGLPAVADPGARLVAEAHLMGLTVQVLPGPSSLLLALAASGLNGQSFAFVGYLPQEAGARQARIRELETISRRHQQTQLMIETPYRNDALMQALVATLAPGTQLSVSRGLTLAHAQTQSRSVAQWRRGAAQGLNDSPAVFSFLAV